MTPPPKTPKTPAQPTEAEVAAYLKAHPDFWKRHPDLLAKMTVPAAKSGGKVVDFQSFAIRNLQESLQEKDQQFKELVLHARDSNSVQGQIHQAILRLIHARSLEALLEVITLDLAQIFALDVVRLSMESDLPCLYETCFPEENASGIVFTEPGIAEALMGQDGAVLICEDIANVDLPGMGEIFAECEWLVRSCILLRLHLEQAPSEVILAFGSREAGAFQVGQAVDLMEFLGDVVAGCLDICLSKTDPIL